MGRPIIDIKGQRFGSLTAVGVSRERSAGGEAVWECVCECGATAYATGSALRRGRTNFCKPCRDAQAKLSPIKGIYGNYKRHAKNAGRVFELSLRQFSELIRQDCYYCGSPPLQYYKKAQAREGVHYNGVDRKDNDLGYAVDNTVPCCKFCNLAKNRFPLEEFLQWLDRVRC